MRRDLFALEGGAVLLCGGHIFGHQIRYTITPQRSAAGTGKHRCCRAALLLALPGAQGGDRVFAERRTPLFAAFPLTADMGSCPQRDVVPAEPAYLGDAQARLDPQEQQRPIASPHPRLLIRRGQERLDLTVGQKGNRRPVVAFTGNRQDALDEAAVARYPERRIVEKGVNRCEADIPAAGACATLVLKVIEKRTDHRRVQIVQRHHRWCFAQPLLGKAQEQTKLIIPNWWISSKILTLPETADENAQ
jgi:hypothetical protein